MAKKRAEKKWTWFKFDWVDYEPPTEHLTTQQHGAYFLLIKHCMKTGKALTQSHMPGIAKASRHEWDTELWPVLQEFFHLGEDGLYHNKRADEEIAERVEISATKAAAAAASHENEDKRRALREERKRLAAQPDPAPVCTAPAHGLHMQVQVQEQIQEEVPPSEGGEPPAVPVQASLLPEPEKPPPTIRQVLWAEGLGILSSIAKASPAKLRSSLAEFEKIAGPEAVLEILRDCKEAPPKGSIYAWVKRCCEERAKAAGIRLVVSNPDPADPWGIQGWCETIADAKPTEEVDRPKGKWLLNGRIVDTFALRAVQAARLPRSWRGDLTAVAEWSRAGIPLAKAIDAITARAEWDGYDPSQIMSLALFNTSVMGRRAA